MALAAIQTKIAAPVSRHSQISTLVQEGEVQLVDLDRNQLPPRRTITFRGDTDTAFRRAAGFVGETLKDALPKPK